MKRLALFAVAALLCSGLAFGEGVSISGWGRGLIVPVIGTSDGISQALGVSWGALPRVGVTVKGSSSNVGFAFDLNADGAAIASNGTAEIWVKPFDWAQLEVGNYDNATLGGGTDFGSIDWLRIVDGTGTFKGFGSGKNAANAALSVTPVKGLFAFANLNKLSYTKATLEQLQYGAGYELQGVGHLRAQVVGDKTGTVDKSYFNAAAKITALPGLYADVGVNVPFDSASAASGYSFKLTAYANYTLAKAKLHGLGIYKINTVGDPAMEGGAGLDYDLDGLKLTSDLRYQNKTAHGDDNSLIGGMVGLTKDLNSGKVGIGIEVSTTKFLSGTPAASFEAPATDDPKKMHFAIPIKLEYYF